MQNKLKNWLKNYPEIPLFAAALTLWLLVGLMLAPVTATYGLAFVHKFTVFLARLAVSVSATMLLVRWLFPTIRKFRKQYFARLFFTADDGLESWDKQRVLATLAVYLAVWLGCILALSL